MCGLARFSPPFKRLLAFRQGLSPPRLITPSQIAGVRRKECLMTQYDTGSRNPDVGIVNTIATPADRVRWGAIIGGLFATISTLVLLGVLGMAVGLTAYDPGETVGEGFAWGAAIWGVITAIAAFFLDRKSTRL